MHLFRPKKATKKQWRRLKKSMRGATSPRPSSLSTSFGRTTGYGKISGTEKILLSQSALSYTSREPAEHKTIVDFYFNTFTYILCNH